MRGNKTDRQTVKKQAPVDLKTEKLTVKEISQPEHTDDQVLNDSISEDQMKEMLGGRYELNALMKGALEHEMKQIMAKVRKELDSPASPAEKMVVNIFQKNACDSIKTVLATNVAQRVLNVPKSFYVKIQLGSRPPVNWLRTFTQKYNVASLKYLENAKKAFVVKVNSFSDFDRVCATNGRNIVGVRITAVPIHQFARCPANMKTPILDSTSDSNEQKSAADESKHNDDKAQDATVPDSTKKTAPITKDNNTKVTAVDSNKKTAPNTKDNNSKVTAVDSTKNTATNTKDNNAKVTVVESTKKTAPNTTDNNSKVTAVDSTKNTATNTKDNNSIVVAANKVPTEVKKDDVSLTKKADENTEVNVISNTPKVTNEKVKSNVAKNTVKNKVTKDISVAKADAMDEDLDFLSIMNEGIVLDECSGSDIE